MSVGFGDDKGRAGSLVIALEGTSGGGSINVVEFVGTIGSGKAGISSVPDEVSIVIWLVGLGPCRKV
jgi:hypothetical protein